MRHKGGTIVLRMLGVVSVGRKVTPYRATRCTRATWLTWKHPWATTFSFSLSLIHFTLCFFSTRNPHLPFFFTCLYILVMTITTNPDWASGNFEIISVDGVRFCALATTLDAAR